ncbi:MAG: hypothetical protein HS115_06575 [Spirochaetales bacterium]|nr:hypothetical protein [Spirochaetales bacterium]
MARNPGRIIAPQLLWEGEVAAWRSLLERFYHVEDYDPARLNANYFRELSGRGADLLIFPAAFSLQTEWIAPGFQGALGSVSTGTDHINRLELKERGISFFHAPGCNAASVAEFCAGLLALLFPEVEDLRTQHLGIVGYGRIGQLLGQIARAAELPFSFYDPFLGDPDIGVLKEATLISFHVPLTRDGPFPTQGMVTSRYIEQLRSCRTIINTARGGIWTEDGLASAAHLDLCFDVFPVEPPGHLYGCRYASPHVAGYNASARHRGLQMVLDAFLSTKGQCISWPPLRSRATEFSGFTAPAVEDALLRTDPGQFARRRAEYPWRGDIFDLRLESLSPNGRFLAERVRDALC